MDLRIREQIRLGRDGSTQSLDGDRVTYPTESHRGGFLDSVAILDLASRKRSVVARTSFPTGFINWAVSAGDWTVYVDQSNEQGDGSPFVLWRVRALNRVTHETRTLASNRNKPDAFVPRVYSTDGYVYWSSAEKDTTARESLWRPEWVAPRYVLRHSRFAPTRESVDDGWLYYQGPPKNRTKDPLASDCWRVRLDGTGAEVLTNSGLVMTCAADNGWLVWTNHIDPLTPSPPEDGIGDDPYELWARKVNGEPRLLHRGYFSSAVPTVAGDFVAWQNSDFELTVTSLDDPEVSQVVSGDASVQTSLHDGDTWALLTTKGDDVVANLVDLRELGLVR